MHTPFLETKEQQKGKCDITKLIFFLKMCDLCDKTEHHARGTVGCIAVQFWFISPIKWMCRTCLRHRMNLPEEVWWLTLYVTM